MFLTADEVDALTGYRQQRRQMRWLRENGYSFRPDHLGLPLVPREQPNIANADSLPTPEQIVGAALSRNDLAGVYFLIDRGEIVYVGRSRNVIRRLNEHWQIIGFTSWSYIQCADAGDADALEKYYIRLIRPRLNQQQKR